MTFNLEPMVFDILMRTKYILKLSHVRVSGLKEAVLIFGDGLVLLATVNSHINREIRCLFMYNIYHSTDQY